MNLDENLTAVEPELVCNGDDDSIMTTTNELVEDAEENDDGM